MEINFNNIPDELRRHPHWVNWTVEERDSRPTKIPINPTTERHAKSNNSNTWATFEKALEVYKACENERIAGVGFVFSKDDDYSGTDLDHCRNPETGAIEPWAMRVIEALNSYSEISPSGTGIKIFTRGSLPIAGSGSKNGNIEMYHRKRFFTITGWHLEGTPLTIESRQDQIKKIHAQYFGHRKSSPTNLFPPTSVNASDSELIQKAKQASNGHKFSKLLAGDWSDYPSQSEADLSFCSMLAFLTGRDPTRIDQLFRQSGLMRPKWDEKHFGDGTTYSQATIQKAIEGTTEKYAGPKRQDENVTPGGQTSTKVGARELSYLNLNLPSSLEISQMEIRVEWIVDNLIPKESITLLHSIGGVGKSYLMFGMGHAVADGKSFFGLNVKKMNVYYIDFENPLPEIVDRMKKMGGCENFKMWHLGHDPMPVRFDADEWQIYKTFPPGLFIIDSLRSSHALEENSSKDASFIMARHKEIRALGNTIILIHHENKIGGYRGSTAWFDLSDHILKFSRVRAIGSDEDASEEDFDLPIRLGLGGKSRFSSAMDLKPMYFKFEHQQLCCADDPNEEILIKMADLLNPSTPPNQVQFQKLVKENLGIGKDKFRVLLKMGESKTMWVPLKSKTGNKLEYWKR